MATMKTLVDKYPGGYEEWEKQNANRIAQAANASQAHDNTDDHTA